MREEEYLRVIKDLIHSFAERIEALAQREWDARCELMGVREARRRRRPMAAKPFPVVRRCPARLRASLAAAPARKGE